MKKTLYLIVITAFAVSCSAPKEEAGDATSSESEKESIYSYTGSFEMGDKANQQLVRDLTTAFQSNDMEALSGLFADSVSFYFSDGYKFSNTRDSAMAMVSSYRESLTSVEVTHLAGMAINSTEHGHQWALSWTLENHANEEGDHMAVYQESFLIVDGKIRSMRQFEQIPNQADAGEDSESGEAEDYTYSGDFTLADPSLVDIVIDLNDAVATPSDMDGIAAQFADSVTIIGHDGFYFNSTRDSLMTMAEEWFSNYSSITNDYIASIAVTSHREEDWVLLWYESESTKNDGTVTKSIFHEDYLIEDGKVRVIRGYKREAEPKEEESAPDEGEQS